MFKRFRRKDEGLEETQQSIQEAEARGPRSLEERANNSTASQIRYKGVLYKVTPEIRAELEVMLSQKKTHGEVTREAYKQLLSLGYRPPEPGEVPHEEIVFEQAKNLKKCIDHIEKIYNQAEKDPPDWMGSAKRALNAAQRYMREQSQANLTFTGPYSPGGPALDISALD